MRRSLAAAALLAASALTLSGCSALGFGGDDTLVVYSGRSQELIGPVLDRFEEESGITVQVKYGGTAQLAAILLEEGERSPADVYIAQDAGALGAVQDAEMFAPLPDELLSRVPEWARSQQGEWVGLSGRARVVVYNTEALDESELPPSILDFTDPKWRGRLAWAPTNGSFQAWVTALRVKLGDDAAREWLEGIIANDVQSYQNNVAIVDAVGRGEVDLGFVNHYYLPRFLEEQGEDFPARNYYTAPGDIGTLVNVAGGGVLATSDQPEDAERLIEYLLSEDAQTFFAEENHEYPLIEGVEAEGLPPIREIEPVEIDLSNLDDLEGTLRLLREVGALS